MESGEETAVSRAVDRILLIHSMIMAFGGIPLLYMGDELGLLNDHSYQFEPDLAADNRWMHRPKMDWAAAAGRGDGQGVNGRLFQGICRLIEARKQMDAFHAQASKRPVWTNNDHVFGLLRHSPRGQVLVLGNFSDQPQTITRQRLAELGFGGALLDRLNKRYFDGWFELRLEPYQAVWLEKAGE